MSGVLVKMCLAPWGALSFVRGAPFLVGALGALFLMALLLAAGVANAQPPRHFQRRSGRRASATEALDLTGARRIEWAAAQGGSWHDAAHWSGGEVPGDSDVAVVALPGTYEVVLDRDAVVAALEMSGKHGSPTLALPGPTLQIRGASRVGPGAVLHLDGGRVTGSGALEVAGHLRWSAGSMSGLGTTRIAPTGQLTVDGERRRELSLRLLVSRGPVG